MGHPKFSSQAHLQDIRLLLEKDPQCYGSKKLHWTGPAIVRALKTKWGIAIHPKYIYRWLDRNGLKGILGQKSKPSAPTDHKHK